MTRREQLVLLFLGLAIVVGSVVLMATRPAEISPPADPDPLPTPAVAEVFVEANPPEPSRVAPVPEPIVVVSLRGAVENPGIYELAKGSRIDDLLRHAGGESEHADLSDINLAAALIDGTTLTVPEASRSRTADGQIVLRRGSSVRAPNPPSYTLSGWDRSGGPVQNELPITVGDIAAPTGVIAASAQQGDRLDLNRATQAQLEGLPGVGPVLAHAIIQHREEHPFQSVDELMDVPGIGPKRLEAVRELVAVNR